MYLKYLLFGAILLTGCFPDFKPEKILKKRLLLNNGNVEWWKVAGNLDQNFPGYIIFNTDETIDTICKAYNIADIKLDRQKIIIGTYGVPKMSAIGIIIPSTLKGHAILLDTGYIETGQ